MVGCKGLLSGSYLGSRVWFGSPAVVKWESLVVRLIFIDSVGTRAGSAGVPPAQELAAQDDEGFSKRSPFASLGARDGRMRPSPHRCRAALALAIYQRHYVFGVTLARGGVFGEDFVKAREVFLRELEF